MQDLSSQSTCSGHRMQGFTYLFVERAVRADRPRQWAWKTRGIGLRKILIANNVCHITFMRSVVSQRSISGQSNANQKQINWVNNPCNETKWEKVYLSVYRAVGFEFAVGAGTASRVPYGSPLHEHFLAVSERIATFGASVWWTEWRADLKHWTDLAQVGWKWFSPAWSTFPVM